MNECLTTPDHKIPLSRPIALLYLSFLNYYLICSVFFVLFFVEWEPAVVLRYRIGLI